MVKREKKQVQSISVLFGSKCLVVTRYISYASVWQGPPFWTAQIWGKAVCHWGFVGASLTPEALFQGPGDMVLAWDFF